MSAATTELTLSARLAEFGTSLSLEAIDDATLTKAKLHLLDTLGAAVGGAASAEAGAARRAYSVTGVPGSAPIWGTGVTTQPHLAALQNGVAAHALELDDTDGCDHSGAVVAPAVLAAAGMRPTTGEAVLRGLLFGYEVARRVMDASGGYAACNAAGWHSTGTCGSFGAAAGAGVALGLPAQQLAGAIGLAGSFTGGLWAFIADGAMSKRLHAGRAAENGLTSALLAREGFTGPTRIFEAEWGGYLGTYVGAAADPGQLVDGLGSEWRANLASIKPYPSCRDTHSGIDAVLDHLGDAAGTDVDAIESITITMPEFTARMCGSTVVGSVVDAQMSLPYCTAATLVHGRFGLAELGEDVLADSRIGRLLSRTTVRVDRGRAPQAPPSFDIGLGDGRRRAFTGRAPLGSAGRPMSAEQVTSKFLGLAEPVLGSEHARSLTDAVLHLERLDDVGGLLATLRSGPR